VLGAFAELLPEHVDLAERPKQQLQVCLVFFVTFFGYQSILQIVYLTYYIRLYL
jgi:hypothetical protein